VAADDAAAVPPAETEARALCTAVAEEELADVGAVSDMVADAAGVDVGVGRTDGSEALAVGEAGADVAT